MPESRHLILATVTAVNDTQVVYPNCVVCYTKLLRDDHEDKDRWWCCRCKKFHDKIEWRFRLCLTITDGSALASVCSFGKNLQQYFGMSSEKFKKYLDHIEINGSHGNIEQIVFTSLKQTFIGQCFYFGFKTMSKYGNCLRDIVNTSLSPVKSQHCKDKTSHIAVYQVIPSTGAEIYTVFDAINDNLKSAEDLSKEEHIVLSSPHPNSLDFKLRSNSPNARCPRIILKDIFSNSNCDTVNGRSDIINSSTQSFGQETALLSCELSSLRNETGNVSSSGNISTNQRHKQHIQNCSSFLNNKMYSQEKCVRFNNTCSIKKESKIPIGGIKVEAIENAGDGQCFYPPVFSDETGLFCHEGVCSESIQFNHQKFSNGCGSYKENVGTDKERQGDLCSPPQHKDCYGEKSQIKEETCHSLYCTSVCSEIPTKQDTSNPCPKTWTKQGTSGPCSESLIKRGTSGPCSESLIKRGTSGPCSESLIKRGTSGPCSESLIKQGTSGPCSESLIKQGTSGPCSESLIKRSTSGQCSESLMKQGTSGPCSESLIKQGTSGPCSESLIKQGTSVSCPKTLAKKDLSSTSFNDSSLLLACDEQVMEACSTSTAIQIKKSESPLIDYNKKTGCLICPGGNVSNSERATASNHVTTEKSQNVEDKQQITVLPESEDIYAYLDLTGDWEEAWGFVSQEEGTSSSSSNHKQIHHNKNTDDALCGTTPVTKAQPLLTIQRNTEVDLLEESLGDKIFCTQERSNCYNKAKRPNNTNSSPTFSFKTKSTCSRKMEKSKKVENKYIAEQPDQLSDESASLDFAYTSAQFSDPQNDSFGELSSDEMSSMSEEICESTEELKNVQTMYSCSKPIMSKTEVMWKEDSDLVTKETVATLYFAKTSKQDYNDVLCGVDSVSEDIYSQLNGRCTKSNVSNLQGGITTDKHQTEDKLNLDCEIIINRNNVKYHKSCQKFPNKSGDSMSVLVTDKSNDRSLCPAEKPFTESESLDSEVNRNNVAGVQRCKTSLSPVDRKQEHVLSSPACNMMHNSYIAESVVLDNSGDLFSTSASCHERSMSDRSLIQKRKGTQHPSLEEKDNKILFNGCKPQMRSVQFARRLSCTKTVPLIDLEMKINKCSRFLPEYLAKVPKSCLKRQYPSKVLSPVLNRTNEVFSQDLFPSSIPKKSTPLMFNSNPASQNLFTPSPDSNLSFLDCIVKSNSCQVKRNFKFIFPTGKLVSKKLVSTPKNEVLSITRNESDDKDKNCEVEMNALNTSYNSEPLFADSFDDVIANISSEGQVNSFNSNRDTPEDKNTQEVLVHSSVCLKRNLTSADILSPDLFGNSWQDSNDSVDQNRLLQALPVKRLFLD